MISDGELICGLIFWAVVLSVLTWGSTRAMNIVANLLYGFAALLAVGIVLIVLLR